ncbi:hypothetical protein ACN4EG_07275 [Alkalinema pantanalense CENA528]|uniref:hypothetical protein n=1 Tax=Alkalinema pantanalense TaxID=1620705 RepID=UPI003D701BEA
MNRQTFPQQISPRQTAPRSARSLTWVLACTSALAIGLPLGQALYRTIGYFGGTNWLWLLGWLGGAIVPGLCLGGLQGWVLYSENWGDRHLLDRHLSEQQLSEQHLSVRLGSRCFSLPKWLLRWICGTGLGWLIASSMALFVRHWLFGQVNLAVFPYLPLGVVWAMSRYTSEAIAGAFMGVVLAWIQLVCLQRSWKFSQPLRRWLVANALGGMLGSLVAAGVMTSLMPNFLALLVTGATLGGIYGWMTANWLGWVRSIVG